MLLTEQEAMTQRCIGPEGCGRHASELRGEGEHAEFVYLDRRCIGSACKMAWRWTNYWQSADGDVAEVNYLEGARRPEPWHRVGYCGIAGRPE